MNRAWKVCVVLGMVLMLRAADVRAQENDGDDPAPEKAQAVKKVDPVADVFTLPRNFTPNKLQEGLLAKLREENEPKVRELLSTIASGDAVERKRADEAMQSLRVKIKRQMNNIIDEDPRDDSTAKKAVTAKPRRESTRVAEKADRPAVSAESRSKSSKTYRESKGPAAKPAREPKTPKTPKTTKAPKTTKTKPTAKSKTPAVGPQGSSRSSDDRSSRSTKKKVGPVD